MHYLTVGVLCIDEVLDLAAYPVEDSKVRADSRTITRGGSAGNAAVILSRLIQQGDHGGVASARVCAAISKDNEGDLIEKDCLKNGVLADCIVWRDPSRESTPKSVVLRVKDTRTIIHYRNSADLWFSEFEDILRNSLSSRMDLKNSPLWVHFEGRNTVETLRMMNLVRQSDFGLQTRLSLELERSRTGDEHKLLEASPEVVVFSQNFFKSLGYKDFRSYIVFLIEGGFGPRLREQALWVCTMGDQGSLAVLVTQTSVGEIIECPAGQVEQVVDSLGAGDAFLAGLIYAIGTLSQTGLDAVNFATKVASEKIQRIGL